MSNCERYKSVIFQNSSRSFTLSSISKSIEPNRVLSTMRPFNHFSSTTCNVTSPCRTCLRGPLNFCTNRARYSSGITTNTPLLFIKLSA
jgi:hypothetical protein